MYLRFIKNILVHVNLVLIAFIRFMFKVPTLDPKSFHLCHTEIMIYACLVVSIKHLGFVY